MTGKKRKYIVGGNGICKAKMDREDIFFIEKKVTQCEMRSEGKKITGSFQGFLT